MRKECLHLLLVFLWSLSLRAQTPVHYYSAAAASATTISVNSVAIPTTDSIIVALGTTSNSNSYTLSATGSGCTSITFPTKVGGNLETWVSYAENITGGVTCTITGSTTGSAANLVIEVEVVSGLVQASYDTSNLTFTPNVSSISTSLTSQGSADYLAAIMFNDNCTSSFSSSTGYTLRGSVALTGGSNGALGFLDLNAAAGSQTSTTNIGCGVGHQTQWLFAFKSVDTTFGVRQAQPYNLTGTSVSASLQVDAYHGAPIKTGGSMVIARVNPSLWAGNSGTSLQPLLSDDAGDNCSFPFAPTGWRNAAPFSNITLACINVTPGNRTFTLTSIGGTSQTYGFDLVELVGLSTTQPEVAGNVTFTGTTATLTVPSVPLAAGAYLLLGTIFDTTCGDTFPASSGWTNNLDSPSGSGCSPIRTVVSQIITNPGSMTYTTGNAASNSSTMELVALQAATNANPRWAQNIRFGTDPAAGSAVIQTDYPVQSGDLALLIQNINGSNSTPPTSTRRGTWRLAAGSTSGPFQAYYIIYGDSGVDQITMTGANQSAFYHQFHGYNELQFTNWTNCGSSVTACADGGITTTQANGFVDSFLMWGSSTVSSIAPSSGWSFSGFATSHNTFIGAAFQYLTSAGTYQDSWTGTPATQLSAAIFGLSVNPAETKSGGKIKDGGKWKAQ